MNMTGEQRIAAARLRVWEALNDAAVLRESIPGCQSLEKEAADRFAATVEIKVGPIGARFKGSVTLTDIDAANGYTLVLQGNGGISGSVKGSAKVRLSDAAGGTLVVYEVDAQMGGRMAQLGGPLIDATAKQLAAKFFGRFGEIVSGAAASASSGDPAAAAPGFTARGPRPSVALQAAAPGGLPMAWILTTVVATFAGFFIGRSQSASASDWAGLAIGLLVITVAGAAFEYGRRAATPVLMLDSALLQRLLERAKE